MIRELFHIGSLSISPFGVMLVAAFLVAYFQLRWGMKQRGIGNDDDASAILFAAGLGGIVGGKLYYSFLHGDWTPFFDALLHNWGLFFKEPGDVFGPTALFDRSGLVWYGGFLLATALVLWTFRRRRLPFWPVLDAATLGLALGYGVGRIGCFLVGDDYGVPTDLPWGVEFPVGLPPTTVGSLREFGVDLPAGLAPDTLLAVHPTQLYEFALATLVWLAGRAYFKRRPPAGHTALLVLALLALERFAIEFLRAKDDRFLGGFTLAQAISLGVLAVIAAVWAARRRQAVAA